MPRLQSGSCFAFSSNRYNTSPLILLWSQTVPRHGTGWIFADATDGIGTAFGADRHSVFDVMHYVAESNSASRIVMRFQCPLFFRAVDLAEVIDAGVFGGGHQTRSLVLNHICPSTQVQYDEPYPKALFTRWSHGVNNTDPRIPLRKTTSVVRRVRNDSRRARARRGLWPGNRPWPGRDAVRRTTSCRCN